MRRPPFVSAHEQPASRAVGHVSQTGALNACGPACMLMLLRDRGLAMDVSARAAAISIDRLDKYTSADDLARLAALHGQATLRGVNIRGAYIALVWYQDMPDANKMLAYQGARGGFWHWIVVLPDGKYFDPLHYTDNGQPFTATIADDVQHRISLVPVEVPAKMTQIKIIGDWWREREDTGGANGVPTGRVFGVLRRGAVMQAEIVAASGTTWARVPISSGGHALTTEANSPVYGYLMAGPGWRIETVTPPVRAPFRLGVHVINDHGRAQQAYDNGVRSIVWMDGHLGAVQFAQAHPDCYVIYRRYVAQARMTAEMWVSALEVSADDPANLFYTAYNESDSIGTSPDEIRLRGATDVDIAKRIRAIAPQLTFLAGSFAHGNPDITSDAVCRAMRETYAGAFNSGLLDFDLHNYTYGKRFPAHPVPGSPFIGPEWFELRAQFFVDKCGFIKRQGFWSTETGVEARPANGGFSGAGYTEQQLYEWSRWAIDTASASGLFRAWNIFQFGNSAHWADYDITGIANGLYRAIRGPA